MNQLVARAFISLLSSRQYNRLHPRSWNFALRALRYTMKSPVFYGSLLLPRELELCPEQFQGNPSVAEPFLGDPSSLLLAPEHVCHAFELKNPKNRKQGQGWDLSATFENSFRDLIHATNSKWLVDLENTRDDTEQRERVTKIIKNRL